MKPEGFQLKAKTCSLVICLLAFGLLVYHLDEASMWADETRTVEWVQRLAQGGFASFIDQSVLHPLSHPPLYFLCLHVWTIIMGESEFALRFLSVFFGLLCTAMLYPLGTRMVNRGVGLVAMGLMAISPFVVMYSRMARPYSLALFFVLVSSWFFIQLSVGPRAAAMWAAYIISSVLAVYTEYFAGFVLAAQGAVALAAVRRNRISALQLLAAQVAVLMLFAPWLSIAIPLVAELQTGPLAFARGNLTQWILSAMHPFFAWTVGETLYPWNPAALLGVTLVLWIASKGLTSASLPRAGEDLGDEARQHPAARGRPVPPDPRSQPYWPPRAATIPTFVFVPLFLTIVANRCVLSEKTFLDVANKAVFCAPFLYLLFGRGLFALSRPAQRILVLSILAVVLGLSLTNYYLGREFHNPNQALPTSIITHAISQQAGSGDIFVSDPTIGFYHYISKEDPQAIHFFADDPDRAKDYISAHRSPGVWLVLLCRAVEPESLATAELVPWLVDAGYSPELAVRYAPLDKAYASFQQLVLGKPACHYKVIAQRFALAQPELEKADQ
jgi:4-amino-4-deoxy-L-arabinose transferase-like glycosyltransferase